MKPILKRQQTTTAVRAARRKNDRFMGADDGDGLLTFEEVSAIEQPTVPASVRPRIAW
jgi:hypothetical protein